MRQNQKAKDELRLKQCVGILRAIVATFSEPIVLDALAVVVETPDGKAILSSAAEFSRAIQEVEQATSGPA